MRVFEIDQDMDHAGMSELREVFDRLAGSAEDVRIDLSKVRFMDSAGIVGLVQQAIIASFNGTDGSLRARVASLILASKFYAPVSLIGPEVSILSILIGFTSSPASNSLQMGIAQVPTITAGDIAVSLV